MPFEIGNFSLRVRCSVVWNYREVNLFKFMGFLWIFWITFNFALCQVWKQIWKQDNEATIKTVHRWIALVNMSPQGKAFYPSGHITKACLTVEISLTVVVYPAVVVYQKVVVEVVLLEMIISGTTIMAARTWIISRRKRFRSLTENVAQIQDDPYEQDGFHDELSCLKNIPYKVFSYLEWMSFEITFNLE